MHPWTPGASQMRMAQPLQQRLAWPAHSAPAISQAPGFSTKPWNLRNPAISKIPCCAGLFADP